MNISFLLQNIHISIANGAIKQIAHNFFLKLLKVGIALEFCGNNNVSDALITLTAHVYMVNTVNRTSILYAQ